MRARCLRFVGLRSFLVAAFVCLTFLVPVSSPAQEVVAGGDSSAWRTAVPAGVGAVLFGAGGPTTFALAALDNPPTATITSPQEGDCVYVSEPDGDDLVVIFTVADDVPGDLPKCEVLLDGQVVDTEAPCSQGSHFVGNLFPFDGAHTLQIRATDTGGNVGLSSLVNFTVDSTPPTAHVTSPRDGVCVTAAVFTASISDNLPGDLKKCDLLVDGQVKETRSPCPQGTASFGPYALPDGPHGVMVIATDNCGNVVFSQTVHFTLDATAPTASITSLKDGDCIVYDKGHPFLVKATVGDNIPGNLEKCVVLLDGVPATTLAPCPPGPHTFGPFLPLDGPHTLQIQVTDACGNVGTSAVVNFIVDNTKPTATINSPTEGACAGDPVKIDYTVTDSRLGDLGKCEVIVDGVVQHTDAPCPQGPHSFTMVLQDGAHTVQIHVVDACGNENTSAVVHFTARLERPTCNIISPTEGATIAGPVTVKFSVADALPGDLKWVLMIDGGVLDHNDSALQGTYSSGPHFLALGQHQIVLEVTDDCGTNSICGPVTITISDGGCAGLALPNLIVGSSVGDPFTGQPAKSFRPELLNVDGFSVRDVLTRNNVTIDQNVVVQSVRVSKLTSALKCTAFGSGPGSGFNTNFDSGLVVATTQNLDDPVCALALVMPKDRPCLGNRCLLFSPPCTTYTFSVTYTLRNPVTGRIGVPKTATLQWVVEDPTRSDIRNNIEYFTTVAAGRTQKPKIASDVAVALNKALNEPDDLSALLDFEYVIAVASTDFSVLRDATDPRFALGYLVDSDEEPIGCLLIEMANFALWH